MANRQQALVTGASGFIGSHLVRALRGAGWSVRCLIRETSSRERLPREGVELAIGNLADIASLKQALTGVKTVFHLAGRVRASSRDEFFLANRGGTKNLLQAARESGGVESFVYVSSLSAAGPSPDGHLLREDEEPRPVSFYGESKLAAEREALRCREDFAVTILRPAAVYGPGDRDSLEVVKMAQRGWRFQPGGAGFTFSSLHVDDVTDSILRAAGRAGGEPAVYFLADGNSYTWEETFAILREILGERACRRKIPWAAGNSVLRLAAGLFPRSPAAFYLDKLREMSHKYWVCDIGRARAELGFSPRYDFSRGLRETIEWYREAGWL